METPNFNYENRLSENCKGIRSSFLREILEVGDVPGLISFAGGLPNPDLFPVAELKEALEIVMTKGAKATLQYAGSQGYLPLREWISARYLARFGVHVSPENIIITNGSQQALDLSGKLFLDKGDFILLEKPSYIGAIQAFSAYQVNMKQVLLDENGISICELKSAIKKYHPKFLYGIPNYQNPTGISYSDETRTKLTEVLKAEKLVFIEDDPYSEIYFKKSNPIPVSLNLPDQCILTGSFSKMISPGIRTGWMVVPPKLKPFVLKAKQAADLHTNNIVQHLIHQFLIDNNIDLHLDKIRCDYLLQKNVMLKEVDKYFPEGTKTTNPDGGMFLWATLPEIFDTTALVDLAFREGVIFVPGKTFYVNGDGNRSMRLNFTNSSPDEIHTGMMRMERAMDNYEMIKESKVIHH